MTNAARIQPLSHRPEPREESPARRGVAASFGEESSATLIVSSIEIHPGEALIQPTPVASTFDFEVRAFSSSSPLRPGARFGPYRLLVRLGGGAQGEVWKALSDEGAAPRAEAVALKILIPGHSRQPRRLAQFRREAERGARLAGPPLLRVLETGEVDGHLYMTMPFVEGVTIRDVIRARRARRDGEDFEPGHPFDTLGEPAYTVAMGRALARAARALHALHLDRVAHRDVKPANVLLDRGRPVGVYLCDLGLGRDLEIATREQMRDGAGTPLFMAPERLLKAPADEERSDVYSMGATMFEALTLERLYDLPPGLHPNSLGAYIIGSTPRVPRALNPALPPAIEAVILKATARNPADRHASAAELADELERALPDIDPSLSLDVPPSWRLIRPPHITLNRNPISEAWRV